ncbi:MAG: TolC family protein, partial [Desulfobulbaceae bacterium]
MKTSHCEFTMTRSISFLLLLILCLPGPALSQGTAPRTITLVEAINIALQNNPSIEEAKAKREGALADIKGAEADFLPKASTLYSYTRLAEQPFQRVNGLERFIGDENSHHWDISLTQPLFTGFALTSKKKMTEIAAQIQEIESERVAINVSQDLRIAWFETLFSQRLGQVAEENTAALTAHLKTAQGFYDQGLISRNDLLKAEVALAQARQDKERATADIDIARSRLAT